MMMATGVLASVISMPFRLKTLPIAQARRWQELRLGFALLCNNIRRHLIFDLSDQILEKQFAALEAADLELIGLANRL